MAAGDRTKRIAARARDLIKDEPGVSVGNVDKMYDAINVIQARLCEESTGVQGKTTISVVGGTELYSFPDGFIDELSVIPASQSPLTKIEPWQMTEIKRAGASTDSTTTDPTYYYKWNNQFGFISPGGSAPTGSGTVTLYYWRRPKADGTEDVGSSVDPILDSRWDRALEYGSAWYLSQLPALKALFDEEVERQIGLDSSAKDLTYRVPVNRSYD